MSIGPGTLLQGETTCMALALICMTDHGVFFVQGLVLRTANTAPVWRGGTVRPL